MTTIPTIVVTPSAAARAYSKNAPSGAAADTQGSFGGAVRQAIDQAIQTGHTADSEAMQAISGGGNLTEVVTALSHAAMTLQTATVIRDRVVQAYQDIIKMPI